VSNGQRWERFWGNQSIVDTLDRMIATGRVPQTLLISGAEGVGKAPLARRFGARLLGSPCGVDDKIEQDDLSREDNRTLIAERERWTSDKRGEEPLLFSTHPDFVTFCPEGPLRQISIQQMRLARERAQMLPGRGRWRVFLIDQFDRASNQAADALLKTLEEPPAHLVLLLTAENPFDLPPTIRSRSVHLHLNPLSDEELIAFAHSRGLTDIERRLMYAAGSPGLAWSLDLAAYEKRRAVMLAMLEASAGGSFAHWVDRSESMIASKSEKLDLYFKILYGLLEDILLLMHGHTAARNRDIEGELRMLAGKVSFGWIRAAVAHADELITLQRRNVQKGPSVDQMVLRLRAARLARVYKDTPPTPAAEGVSGALSTPGLGGHPARGLCFH
jgi:DNA polymerase-3 subunit delta'